MDGFAYEEKCARYLRTIGFHRVEVTRHSGDQGIDILAWRLGRKYGIQCKYYRGLVGNHAVMEACAGAQFYHCHKAIVMTNSDFTMAASDLARQTGVVLWPKCKARTGPAGRLLRPMGWLMQLVGLLMLLGCFAWYTGKVPVGEELGALACCGVASLLLMLLRRNRSAVSLAMVLYGAGAYLLQRSGGGFPQTLSFLQSLQTPYLVPAGMSAATLLYWLCLLPCSSMPQEVKYGL